MRRIILSLLPFVLAAPAFAWPEHYDIDKKHTHVMFSVSHEGFSHTIGRIKSFDGFFTFDEKEPEKSTLDVTLNSAGIDTSIPELDKALAGSWFLNTEKFPTMRFKSTKIVATSAKTGDITGDFTLLGVTRPLTLHVTYNRSGIDPFGHASGAGSSYVCGFSADGVIKRSDFGMTAFAKDVGDEVAIHIEVEGSRNAADNGKIFH